MPSSAERIFAVRSICLPWRHTSIFAFSPGVVVLTSIDSSAESRTGSPLYLRITSPALRPASAAALSGSTLDTSAPAGESRPNESASD